MKSYYKSEIGNQFTIRQTSVQSEFRTKESEEIAEGAAVSDVPNKVFEHPVQLN